ncbi:uncharacterized protein SCODWIG_01823 [Saccharomycodes ludwigii]|uniref:Uncharacterized protein n=1 Tax=Saccharomycodes ludwigii TaxID=36035 RepID=A0A376B604_9ASCO|nr:hypothetical protein SCDLUD_000787 [Saccharomycodes ludwigii]KAH3903173.1 hypothetical protein SCDLUD_000787 [Saccharomycodes ludwigii]SSD60062.1 uncharacterized protein SCODWIG_01823 [Saccharomycodes ludwigii]
MDEFNFVDDNNSNSSNEMVGNAAPTVKLYKGKKNNIIKLSQKQEQVQRQQYQRPQQQQIQTSSDEDEEYDHNDIHGNNNLYDEKLSLTKEPTTTLSLSDRLPELYEVLNQQTAAPVDLWTFYNYLAQYPVAINYLDFWIDVVTHLRFCKDYVKSIRKSVLSFNARTSQIRQSHSSIGINNNNNNVSATNISSAQFYNNTSTSNLNNNTRETIPSFLLLKSLRDDDSFIGGPPEPSFGRNSNRQDITSNRSSQRISEFLNVDLQSPELHQLLEKVNGLTSTPQTQNDSSITISTAELMDKFVKAHGVKTHMDSKKLLDNATSIVRTYLLSPEQSSKFLYHTPVATRNWIVQMVMGQNRYDPSVFEDCKILCFHFLEQQMYPLFLKEITYHNLHDDYNTTTNSVFSNYTRLSRILLGLFWLWVGFWIGYTLIFLNYGKGIRVVTIVPFIIGCYYIIVGIFKVDLFYALFGLTQRITSIVSTNGGNNKDSKKNYQNDNEVELGYYTRNTSLRHNFQHIPVIFRFLGGRDRLIKIQSKVIVKLLRRRALWATVWILFCTGCFTVIFSCVPGRRL